MNQTLLQSKQYVGPKKKKPSTLGYSLSLGQTHTHKMAFIWTMNKGLYPLGRTPVQKLWKHFYDWRTPFHDLWHNDKIPSSFPSCFHLLGQTTYTIAANKCGRSQSFSQYLGINMYWWPIKQHRQMLMGPWLQQTPQNILLIYNNESLIISTPETIHPSIF